MIEICFINTPSQRIGGAITAHYHKEGFANIIPNTTSKVKAQAILVSYE